MKNFYLISIVVACLYLQTGFVMAQCPPLTNQVGSNLVVNGDFTAGNTGFFSAYGYGSGGSNGLLTNAGEYVIIDNPNASHTNYASFGDHTTGNGQMMVVNGASVANTVIWSQTIAVQPNTVYTFSTWVASAHSASPAVLQFSINGTNLGTPFTALSTVGVWKQFFVTWYSGFNISVTISIVNQNIAGGGNDFAIDDIYFQECQCNLPAAAGPDTTVCEGSSVQLNATGGDSYQWYPPTGLDNPAIANPVATVTSDITYYAIIISNLGCVDTASVTINVTPQQQISAGVDDTICYGETVQLNGAGTGTVMWYPGSGLNNPNILNPIAAPVQTTDYVLTITDGPCVFNDTVRIVVKSLPRINAGDNDSICYGTSINLNATGNGVVSWSPSTGLSNPSILNPLAAPLQTTQYYLTVDSAGCSNTDSVTITVNPLPQIIAGPDTTVCEGSTLQLNASGGNSYQWYPVTGLNNATIANPVATVTGDITYYVVITSDLGCADTASMTINTVPQQQISAGADDVICYGESVQLIGSGTGVVSWFPQAGLSNPAVLNPVASPLQTTEYVLTITNGPCVFHDTVRIVVKPLPQVNAGTDSSICYGSSINLNGYGNGLVNWSPANTLNNATTLNPVATPLQTTQYILSIDSAACTNRDTVIITVKSLPQVDAGADKAICTGESVQLNGTGTGIITWSPSLGLNNISIINPVAAPSQTTNYILNIEQNGCSNSDTVTVTVNPLPQVNAGVSDSICFGDTIQLNGSGAGAVTWISSAVLSNNQILNPVTSPTQTSTYILQIDSAGCTNTDTISIYVKSLPVVNAGVDDTICAGETIQLNGSGNGIITWSPAFYLNNNTILNPTTTLQQTIPFVLTIEDNGCYNSDTVTVFVKQLPYVNAGSDKSICEGDIIQLSGAGIGTISWLPDSSMNNPNILNPTVSPLQTTEYSLTIFADGCQNSDTVKITVKPLPAVDAGNDLTVCEGETIQLSATGASNYLWSPSVGLNNEGIANPVASLVQTTEFIITGILNGCVNTDTLLVTVVALPVVNAGNDTIVAKETNYTLRGSPENGSWFGENGLLCISCTQHDVVIYNDSRYYYSYADSNGCENTDTVWVYLNKTCKDPFFPTAFSPNDDLLNDFYQPVFEDIHVVKEMEFTIFNKWGETVFHTNRIENGWDGKSNGMIQGIGVYAYVYRYSCERDTRVIKGTFTLVR